MNTAPLYVGPFLHLRTMPAFEALTPAQLRDLAYEAQEVVLPRGSQLIRRGEPAPGMYLIVDGMVEAGSGAPVGPGGVVGFLEVMAAKPAPADAIADTDVVAFRLETDALREVCEQSFAVLTTLLAHVADRVLDDRHALLRSIAGRSAKALEPVGSLDRVGRILALHRAPAFPSHSMDALAELAGHIDEVRALPGDALWRSGEPAGGFYVVCSGSVRLGGGPWREGDHLGPGAAPGIIATLAGRPYEYDAVASEPSLLLRVSVESFMDVIEDHFEMAFETLGRLARHLLESESGHAGRAAPEDGGADASGR